MKIIEHLFGTKKKNTCTENAKPKENDIALGENMTCPQDMNVLVIGSSGSGKGPCFINPNIKRLSNKKNTSAVIVDPNGELWRENHKALEEAGYSVEYFNIDDTDNSGHFNPLNYMFNEEKASQIADTFISCTDSGMDDPFWQNASKQLMRALILYMCANDNYTGRNNIETLIEHASSLTSIREGILKDFYDKATEQGGYPLFVKTYDALSLLPEKTLKSSIASLNVILSAYATKQFLKMTRTDGIKVYTLFNTPTVVFIGVPLYDTSYTFLYKILVNECQNEMLKRSSEAKQPYRVEFYFPECESAGYIDLVNVAKRNGMTFCAAFKSIDQLKHLYGDNWENILAGFDAIVFMGTGRDSDIAYISKLCGTKTTIKAPGGKVDASSPMTKEPVLSEDEIRWLSIDKEVVLVKGQAPVIVNKLS